MCELSWGGEDEEGDKFLALDKSTYINLISYFAQVSWGTDYLKSWASLTLWFEKFHLEEISTLFTIKK